MRAHCAVAGQKMIVREARQLARAAALSVVCIAALLTSHAARSQTPDGASGEVPLGTFNIRNLHDGLSVVEPPAGVPGAKAESNDDGSNRWFFEGWQRAAPADTAEKLYGQAMVALEGGRVDEAQPLFERLIAEAPRSVQATEARRHLGRIYSSITGSTTPTAAPVPSHTGAAATTAAVEPAEASAKAERAAALNIDRPLSRTALQQARVAADIDGRFLSAAGDRVFFSAGSASLGTRAQSVIQAQARFLNQNPWLSAAVEGHADDGALPDQETVELSERRAAIVRDRLIAEGVASERLTAFGRGREERVSDCPDSACLAQNRRTITILLQGRMEDVRRGSGSAAAQPPASQ
jgi:outer membrane protein OmpA-like peptidoglycan-associated protein